MIDAQACRALQWLKAERSQADGMCVEVAPYAGGVALRDSKCPADGALTYSRDEFAAFVDGCRKGEFDHLL
jgi:hypothetical protein